MTRKYEIAFHFCRAWRHGTSCARSMRCAARRRRRGGGVFAWCTTLDRARHVQPRERSFKTRRAAASTDASQSRTRYLPLLLAAAAAPAELSRQSREPNIRPQPPRDPNLQTPRDPLNATVVSARDSLPMSPPTCVYGMRQCGLSERDSPLSPLVSLLLRAHPHGSVERLDLRRMVLGVRWPRLDALLAMRGRQAAAQPHEVVRYVI